MSYCRKRKYLIVLVPSPFNRHEDVLRRLADSGYIFERVAPHTYQYGNFRLDVSRVTIGACADLYVYVDEIFPAKEAAFRIKKYIKACSIINAYAKRVSDREELNREAKKFKEE